MTWLEQQRAFEARARSCEVAGAVKRHAEAIVDTGAAGAGGDRGWQGLCRGSGVADAILQLGAMLVHEGVVEAMRSLLKLPKPPDAVFCYNDSTALVAMKACLNEGLKVPYDIMVVGFDDISSAAVAVPPLSTVHVDKEALGASGVELLLRLKPDEPPAELVLPVQMIVRESSSDD